MKKFHKTKALDEVTETLLQITSKQSYVYAVVLRNCK